MISELSIVPASLDGNSFEIIPGNMTGISYADHLQSLQALGEIPYSRIFVFRREPSKKVLFGGLEALEGYSTGMYILVKTQLTGKNKRSVFAGVAGIEWLPANDYWENRPEPDADCYLSLIECLKKQSDTPPQGIKDWDLAIVIPMQSEPYSPYVKLCNLLDNSEDFICWHESTREMKIDPRKDLATAFSYLQNIDLSSFDFKFLNSLISFLFQMMEEMGARLMEEGVKQLLKAMSGRKVLRAITFFSQNFSLKMKSNEKKVFLSIKISNKDFGDLKIKFVLHKNSDTTR